MFPEYVTWGQVWKGGAVVLGRGKMGTAADGSSAEQSWAQTQSISEQMASLVMTARSGPRDSMSLRNSPSSSGLWGIPWKTKQASPFTYQTILYPSSHLSINIQTSLLPHFHGNGETVDLGSHCLAFRSRSSIRNVCSHQMPNIWIIECFAASDKCVLTCSSCLLGRASHVAPGSSVPPAVRLRHQLTALLGAAPASCWGQQHPDGMLSYCFYRERNKVLCSEESGRLLVLNPSPLLFVWVLWVEMRREVRPCMSHLGIVGAVEESALVSRFIRKTNKGKYSLKM